MANIDRNYADGVQVAWACPTVGTTITIAPFVAGGAVPGKILAGSLQLLQVDLNMIFVTQAQNQPNCADTVRVIIAVDRDSNGVNATPSVFLENSPPDVTSHYAVKNLDRITILYDEMIDCNPTGYNTSTTQNFNTRVSHRAEIDCSCVERTIYSQSAFGFPWTNNLVMLLISQNGFVTASFSVRVWYKAL